MKPFILRDKAGGIFREMPERIMQQLYEVEPPADEPKGWNDFGVDKPFPDKGEQFKQNAVREMVNYFVEVDGQRFYAFGDPTKTPVKQNGEPGINGAHSHAMNAYTKLAKAYKKAGGTSLGELTERLKEYTETKVQEQVDAYLDSKTTAEDEAEAAVEESSQPDLGLQVEEPQPQGGAAYADAIPD